MRYAYILACVAGCLGILGCTLVLGVEDRARGNVAENASLDSTATASNATVRAALKHYRAAVRARAEWSRARRCLGMGRGRLTVTAAPRRSASEHEWLHARRVWKSERADFDARLELLMDRMVCYDTGHSARGGGALRWRPLIRWFWPEWSESQVWLMAHIIWHESSGRPYANRYTYRAYGLFQHLPNPGPINVWAQAKLARYKYVAMGRSLNPWAGCFAFSCPGGCGIY